MTPARELHKAARRFRYDLDGFCRLVFPWGRGPYATWEEPWPWHTALFDSISREAYAKRFGPDYEGVIDRKAPILRAISSGTGTGKSSLVLPTILFWTLSVFPHVRGLAISATREQMGDKFFSDCVALMKASPFLSRYFDSTADGTIFVKGARESTAFVFRTSGSISGLSGTHSFSGVTCVLFEEAAGISDESWLATDGARSDKQVISVACSQPLHLDGFFHRIAFGDLADDWNAIRVSLLDMPMTDEQRAELRRRKEKDHGGEDTDGFRMMVEGKPRTSEANSFISRKDVEAAMERSWIDENGRPLVDADTPVVAGLDLAGHGEEGGALNVMAFRAGLDGRIPPVSIPGHKIEPRDLADWCIQEATRERPPYGKPVVCYYDSTGERGLLAEAFRERGCDDLFWPVNFAQNQPRARVINNRAAMWAAFSRWLFGGAMLPKDEALARTICAARASYDKTGRLEINPKSEIRKMAGDSRLDEQDARLLACHNPPHTARRVRLRTERAKAKRPFSLMG